MHLHLSEALWSHVCSANAITHYGLVPSYSTGATFARSEFSADHHALFGRIRVPRLEGGSY